MLTPRPFLESDLERAAEIWNRYYGPQFPMSASLLRRMVLRHPLYCPDLSIVIESRNEFGFMLIKDSAAGRLYSGAISDTLHISGIAADSDEVLDALLAEISRSSRIQFGADHDHFFPGVPREQKALLRTLNRHGFAGACEPFEKLESDLERDLAEYAPPETVIHAVVRTAVPRDRVPFDLFLGRTFPGRWHYDLLRKIDRGEWGDIALLVINEEICGFAAIQSFATTHMPEASCVWAAAMGDWWGGLGPIGIAPELRGKGLGAFLLGRALSILKLRGVRRCAIDWTRLVDFYGHHGFQVARQYVMVIRDP